MISLFSVIEQVGNVKDAFIISDENTLGKHPHQRKFDEGFMLDTVLMQDLRFFFMAFVVFILCIILPVNSSRRCHFGTCFIRLVVDLKYLNLCAVDSCLLQIIVVYRSVLVKAYAFRYLHIA